MPPMRRKSHIRTQDSPWQLRGTSRFPCLPRGLGLPRQPGPGTGSFLIWAQATAPGGHLSGHPIRITVRWLASVSLEMPAAYRW
jgi:hypothetical protein